MPYESPSYNPERGEKPEEILSAAQKQVKKDLEDESDISEEIIDNYFKDCVNSDREHFILRGIDQDGDIIEQRILQTEELPGSDNTDQTGSIETKKVIADFIKRTLRSSKDIDQLANKDLSYHPEQDN